MKPIVLGKSGSANVEIDLRILLLTRLLIQANSGGGKSWVLRRLIEQLYGKVQCIVIDIAGEFSSLREKFDFVLAGEGGETPVDVRSAALIATKLLELRANAVCDLYSLKPQDRHVWMKNFLGAVMNAPKKLWHPVVFAIDEAHKFMPEKGEGESAAKEEMLSLCSDGRKYGYCSILATQRLAKLDKSGAAEMLNVLIGPTFLDVDLERAHKALGIVRSEWKAFDAEMKSNEPGNFYALGRAISKTRILVKVGDVKTTHPEPGESQYISAPPPSVKIRSLLPQLADLPKLAEAKAKTEQELRAELSQVRRELLAAQKSAPPRVETKERVVEKPIVLNGELKKIEKVVNRLEKIASPIGEFGKQLNIAATTLAGVIQQAGLPKKISSMPPTLPREITVAAKPSLASVQAKHEHVAPVQQNEFTNERWKNGKLPKAERSILAVLAQYPQGRTKTQVAILAGYAVKGGGFQNAVGALKLAGYVSGDRESLKITETGLTALGEWTPLPSGQDLLMYWLRELPKAEHSILSVLAEHYPSTVSKEDIAVATGYEAKGGGFQNAIGKLRTLELIHGRNELKASDVFFE